MRSASGADSSFGSSSASPFVTCRRIDAYDLQEQLIEPFRPRICTPTVIAAQNAS